MILLQMSHIMDIPGEIIINHILNINIFLPLMSTCKRLYDIVGVYIEIGKVNDVKYKQILINKFVISVYCGNTRAMTSLLNVDIMGHLRRDWMTIDALFKECCGLAHREARYKRALRLITNHDIDISRYIYSILTWCAKLKKRDLFDVALRHIHNPNALQDNYEDLLSAFITLDDEYYVNRFLDYVKIREITKVWWCRAHVNLKALVVVLEKLKPKIQINEYIYVNKDERNATTDNIVQLIWPYCDDRSVDIDGVITYSLRLLDHEYLEFITRKLLTREIVPFYYTKINPLLLKLVQASGFTKIYNALSNLSGALDSQQIIY